VDSIERTNLILDYIGLAHSVKTGAWIDIRHLLSTECPLEDIKQLNDILEIALRNKYVLEVKHDGMRSIKEVLNV